MKIQQKDQYDLTQIPPESRPGFILFKQETSKSWMFICNDVEGKPVLFSQGYPQADHARKGMESVLNNLPKRSAVEKNGDHWQFVVTAGNKQEIARSALFENKETCERTLQYARQVAQAKNPEVIAPLKASEVPEDMLEASSTALRHSFRLLFYSDDAGQWTGRIEDVTTQEQESFEGVNMDKIGAFLQKRLHPGDTILKEKVKENAKQPIQLSSTAAQSIQGQLNFDSKGMQPKGTFRMLTRSEQMSLTMQAVTTSDLPEDIHLMGTQLTVYQTGTQIDMAIPVQSVTFDPIQQAIAINAGTPPADVPAGTYQLRAETWFKTNAGLGSVYGMAILHLV